MKSLSIGVVIGATLASSVGSTFRSLENSIGQLQEKANNIKLGITAGEQGFLSESVMADIRKVVDFETPEQAGEAMAKIRAAKTAAMGTAFIAIGPAPEVAARAKGELRK
jgi:hypothetical protein